MAKIVGEVAIDVTADVGPLARQMKKAEGAFSGVESRAVRMGRALGSALGLSVVSAGAAATAVIALARASMQSIDAQAKLAQSLGTTVTSMQALKRAGELAGVSMEGVQQATGDLTRRLAQAASGAGPVADALERLNLTAAGLAKVPLDERVRLINEALDEFIPTTERAAVAGQLFGEEGSLAMARIDTATLRQATEDVHRFGVVVSEQDANQIETANDAMTRLGLVVEGLGNRLAVSLAPAMESTANTIADFAARVLGAKTSLEDFFGTLKNAQSILGEDIFNQLVGDPDKVLAHLEQMDQLDGIYQALSNTISSTADDLARYVVQLRAVGEAGAAEAVDSLVRSMDELQAEFEAGNIEAEEFERRMLALQDEAKSVVVELGSIDAVGFGGVIDRLGALGGALAAAASEARRLRALMPGGMGQDTGTALSGDVTGMMPPSLLAPSSSPRPQQQSVDSYGNFTEAGSASSGGGGGGGADPMTARIEALVESLKTEQEIVAEWYEQSLEALNAASEAELLAVGGKHEALERLEEEHQARLASIKEMGNQWGLQAALSGGAEILNAVGQSNKKALKAAKIFSAAQAMISTYQGAAEELKKGTFGFARAAAVIAKGIGFVTAIRGVSDSGGTGGGGGVGAGGGAASQAQAPAPPTQNFIIDAPGMNIGALVESLNRAADAGYRIRVNSA